MTNFATVLAGISVGAGIVAGAWFVAQPITQIADQQRKITVKGTAEKRIKADVAVWQATMQVRAATLPGAYAQLATTNDTLRRWLAEQGADAAQLALKPVVVQPQFAMTASGATTSTVVGYVLVQPVQVTGKSVDEIVKLALAVPALAKRGADFTEARPEYYVSNIEDIKLSLVSDATANARKRAEEFARSGGLKVGTLRSASQGVFQIVPPNSGDIADFGRYDTTTIDKTVKLVVSVEYGVTR
ncbi:MAG: SIMPL domain-containing protein [Betaproteobacteria bacterium]